MRRKIPATHTLLCFEAAARHESYTRAGRELALTQSAVSRQIGALEQFLGQALFRRTRHGVTLIERGAEYARQIAPRLQALERDTLDAMSGPGTGGRAGGHARRGGSTLRLVRSALRIVFDAGRGSRHWHGAALVPRLLVEAELASGTLVLACEAVAYGDRAYYLVTPERGDSKPALDDFSAWLRDAARVAAD